MRSLILLMLLFASPAFGREIISHGPIDTARLDLRWLEYLIKVKIDSVRKAHELGSLSNDSICYLAARDQAEYISGQKDISHFQNKLKKRTPQDRVVFYGGEQYQAGENLARIYILTPMQGTGKKKRKNIIIRNYEDAAYEIVNGWVNSPGHLQNILHGDYKLTAVALSYDRQTRALNSAQVFANVPSYFLPVRALSFFPYDKVQNAGQLTAKNNSVKEIHRDHAWKVKAKAKSKDMNAWTTYKPNLDYSGLQVSSRTIIFNGGKYRPAQQFLKHRYDGMMAEVVPFSRYECQSGEYSDLPGRRNGGCIFNGIALKPIYRKELLNTNLLGKVPKKKPKKLSLALGKVPQSVGEPNEINVLILKRRNIVGMVQFHHLPDTLFQYSTKLPYLPQVPLKLCACYAPPPEIKKSSNLFYYPVNETIVDSSELRKLKDFLRKQGIRITRMSIRSYASIEGNFGINDRLYKERARIIHDSLRDLIPPGVPVTESAGENWGKFREQVRVPRYAYLAKLDTLSVRQIMNDSATSGLKPLLDAQRYSQVEVEYEVVIRPEDILGKAITEYRTSRADFKARWEKSGRTLQADATTRKKLDQLLDYFMQCILDSSAGDQLLDTLSLLLIDDPAIFQRDPLADLYAKKIAFDFCKRPWLVDENYRYQAYRFLSKRTLPPDPAAEYNYQAYLINHYEDPLYPGFDDVGDLKVLSSVLNTSAKIIDPKVLDEMSLFYHFARARNIAAGEPEKYPDANSSLIWIRDYFNRNECSNDFRVKLALFMLTFQKYDLANSLLEPIISLPARDKQGYILWLKIYYATTGIEDLAYSDYQPLFEAAEWLAPQEFCSLFETHDRINFQLLNYEPLRNLYCRMKLKTN
ncbi:MAG: CAP domain-containing protein [Bacteroidales bacterium]